MRTLKTEMKMERRTEMKRIGNIFLTVALAVALAPLAAFGAGKGEAGGQFLRVGVGARAPAMGGAFSPVADDATAIYWNPAGLAQLEKREVSLSYNMYFEDTAAQFVGYAHPTEDRGTMGGAIRMLSVGDIERRTAAAGDADNPDLGTFNTQDMALSFGWANHRGLLSGRLNYGVAIKYISSDLETESARTAALDMGLIHNVNGGEEGLALSLAVLNLGGELKFKDEGDPLPLNIKPGLAWKKDLDRFGKLTTALDADMLVNDGIMYIQPGFEWWAHESFALRAGYQIGRDEDAGSGFGAGIGLNIVNLGIDYAFVPYGELGDTHRVSLGLKF